MNIDTIYGRKLKNIDTNFQNLILSKSEVFNYEHSSINYRVTIWIN